MRASPLRLSSIALAAFALGSCSYSYKLLAVVIDGRLAFVVDPSSRRDAECIDGITVEAAAGETATAKAGPADDARLVARGIFWQESMKEPCQNQFPVFYGQPLKGERLVHGEDMPDFIADEVRYVVEAKPLRVNVVYEVSTTSGSGYGRVWFRITPHRSIENWPDNPNPALL